MFTRSISETACLQVVRPPAPHLVFSCFANISRFNLVRICSLIMFNMILDCLRQLLYCSATVKLIYYLYFLRTVYLLKEFQTHTSHKQGRVVLCYVYERIVSGFFKMAVLNCLYIQ